MEKKVLMDAITNACRIAGTVGKIAGTKADCETVARNEIAVFMMFLSAADGKITGDEAELISEVCGVAVTPNIIAKYLDEKGVMTKEYATSVPATFELMVAADLMVQKAKGEDPKGSDVLLACYAEIGKEMLGADGDVAEDEKLFFEGYVGNMLKYLKDRK